MCTNPLIIDNMNMNSYVWIRKLITFGFIVLFAFYVGYWIGKNAATTERQDMQMQQVK